MDKCEICNADTGGGYVKIVETKFWNVFLVPDQSYLGRCSLELKRHCENLSELNKDEWGDFTGIVKRLEKALKKAFNATMFNWTCLMNNAYKSKSPVPHVHWHFRPRYDHSVKFNGITFEDKEFGHHYDKKRNLIVSDDIKREISKKIQESM